MPNWNSAINKINLNDSASMNLQHHSELFISEVEPILKLNLRGKKRDFLSMVGKILNIILPTESNTSTSNEYITALWLSPDEWLIFQNNVSNRDDPDDNLEKTLYNDITQNKLGSVTNVSDQFVMINIQGINAYALLSSGCPFNFNNFKKKKGAVTQTHLNHIDVIIYNRDINKIELFVRRSFSNHLWSWMNDSARFI